MALIWFFVAFFIASAIVCVAVTPIVRSLALRYGLVDVPDGRRKLHARPIPVAGGVAVLITAVVVLTALFVFRGPLTSVLRADTWEHFWLAVSIRPELVGLAVSAAILAFLGVVDDLVGMNGKTKFFGQLMAVGVVMSSGVIVRRLSFFGEAYELDYWAIPITAFWLLGAINSLNLIDGLDGLLGSVGCIVCASFAAMAYLNGQYQAAFIATALAGALFGFLFFNFPPATIFLGDCGSMLVGLVVGVLGIQCSLKGAATVSLAAPVALLVIPIFDTSAAIIRRKLTGRSIFTTDRAHLHHRLLDSGLSNRLVLLIVGGLCAIASAGALASMALQNEMIALLSVLVIVSLLVVTRLFGHAEFLLIKERVLDFWNHLRQEGAPGKVHQHAVQLQGSANWSEMWNTVTAAAEEMQFKSVCLDVNAPSLRAGYHARWGRVDSDAETYGYWKTDVPLLVNGQVVGRMEIVGLRGSETIRDPLSQVAKLVEELETGIVELTATAKPQSASHELPSPAEVMESVPSA
jgi:UDP-GlcNAc:undecaprenyl-phosphate GlcNAc-1-phosphate transferase